MPIDLSFDELLAFTDAERAKWNVWIRTQPTATLLAPFQCQGKFSTRLEPVGSPVRSGATPPAAASWRVSSSGLDRYR